MSKNSQIFSGDKLIDNLAQVGTAKKWHFAGSECICMKGEELRVGDVD